LWLFYLFYSCSISFYIIIFFSLQTHFTFSHFLVLQSIVLPSNYPFCPFSSTLFNIFAFSSYHSPTCHHISSPSYTFTTDWLDYHTNHTPLIPPAIPDIITFHYNSGNTHKHTQGPKHPAATIALSDPPFSITFTNYPSF
jgi:hypothetical protein